MPPPHTHTLLKPYTTDVLYNALHKMLNYPEVVFFGPSLTKHANKFLNVQSLDSCLKLEWILLELGCDTKIMEKKTQKTQLVKLCIVLVVKAMGKSQLLRKV